MEAYVTRKRRRLSASLPDTNPPVLENRETPEEDEDSTDFKLALLSSLHPEVEQHILLDVLLDHNGSVEGATTSLTTQDAPATPSKKVIGYQSSLSGFLASGKSPSKRLKTLSKKGKTLHLYSPEDVAAHTPCSIIHKFLPTEDANALLEELLSEAPTFERMTFKLFDNVVQSPHTACFYVESLEEQERQKTEYIYNGDRITDVRQLTPQMRKVSPLVETAVNSEIQTRIKTHYPSGKKLKHQTPHRWTPNAAFVNCYNGPTESVGYHSDQLTYLGPRAVIGSISLGVAREFRLRKIIPQDDTCKDNKTKAEEAADEGGQISIHLPHNSLLVMHAEMQEEYKHAISAAQTIDPHPIAGNRRINITYRHYREELHPKDTPRCGCGVPCVLRVVQRKRENYGKYFWMCYAGNVPGKEGCRYFEWAEWDEDGGPIWKGADKRRECRNEENEGGAKWNKG